MSGFNCALLRFCRERNWRAWIPDRINLCHFVAAVIGTLAGTLSWVLSLSISTSFLDPMQQNRYQTLSRSAKLLTTLFLPNSGLYWCFKLISFKESQGK